MSFDISDARRHWLSYVLWQSDRDVALLMMDIINHANWRDIAEMKTVCE